MPGAAVQLVKPEYRNWLALGHALTTILCQGLRPFLNREMETFYRNVTARVAGPCTCVHVPRRRPNEYHDMHTCAWANMLEAYHLRNKPNWRQSDPTKWTDPVLGSWEIAKLFLPDLGGHADIKSADDMDITGILNLMYWCSHFTIPPALIKDVRDTRNDKWVHVARLELTDANKAVAFHSIENLLKDPQLAADPDAQNSLTEIVNLKNVSDLHIFEAQVVAELIEVFNKEILNLTQQSETSQRELDQLEQLVLLLEKRLEDLEQKADLSSLFQPMLTYFQAAVVIGFQAMLKGFQAVLKGAGSLHDNLVRNLKAIRKEVLVLWLMMVLCCSLFVRLDDDTCIRDGCPLEELSVPFDSKEFGWLDYLNSAKEDFIGRSWLFHELESALDHPVNEGDIRGVLIIGDPGAGKSALSAQLICSRTSSRIIHDHILGYHLCKHSDKNTQIAGKFVRNLAEMIARRIPEYGYLVSNSSYVLRSLNTDCVTIQDPVGCFEQVVLSPLKGLKKVPKENWYVVIDALDECLTQTETSHSIVYLLSNKVSRFPSWLKLVMTSRNEASVSFNSGSIKKIIIQPEDSRNTEDIILFLITKFYRDGYLLHRDSALSGDSGEKSAAEFISALLNKSQGNFLFVKEMIRHWETSRNTTSDPYALPETLEELYHSYFQRLYDGQEQFKPVRRVLEVLVATFQPLTLREIFDALSMKEANLEQEYDFKNRMKELGHFLRYGVNDTITLYHLSMTEWLTSSNNKNGPFYVSKRIGHKVLCDFYFKLISEGGTPALLRYSLILAQHIAYGGWKEAYAKEFLSFPSHAVNSSHSKSNQTLLHLTATINNVEVLKLFLHHFNFVDSPDIHGITPAFLAAAHGLVDNLALLVKKGACVNMKTTSLTSLDFRSDHDFQNAVLESKSKLRGATMLHAAAYGGHLKVVYFLLNNGASISMVNDVNLTALQIAAENGHLEVVKALSGAGEVADQTALHHAAANNSLSVVKYLLEIGLKDKCMRCDGSFYWLKSKHRLQSNRRLTTLPTINILSGIQQEENIPRKAITSRGELFDDKHLIVCETALHAAISSGHNQVAKELISRDTEALACKDYTGRTPLHEAVRRNNKEVVNLLLEKDQAKIYSTCDYFQDARQERNPFIFLTMSRKELMEYHEDICLCGYTPLHLAARYGNWEIAIDLLEKKAMIEAKDCFGATPLHVAACHNHPNMVYGLLKFGSDINSKTFNGSTPLHSAAACGAFEATNQLLDHGAILDATDDSGLTALHYSILNVDSSKFRKYIFEIETRLITNPRCHLAKFYKDENNHVKNTNFYRWLDVFINLILRGSDINAVDIRGRTALHIAAENGLADAVNVLLQRKSQLEVRDKSGQTPLVVAVKSAAVAPKQMHLTVIKRFDDSQRYLRDHEMVARLLLSSGAELKKCNHSGESLLNNAIMKNQLLITQLLLLKGASADCKDNLGRTPLLTFLQGTSNWIDVILKRFGATVDISCGKPFNTSEFHLLCYYRPSQSADNFFYEIVSCDDHTCLRKKGPIVTAIENYPFKYNVIDSCLDAEGFTPLHRAAQGANIVAVSSLIMFGANQSLLSPHGYEALTLAILHAWYNTTWEFFGESEMDKAFRASVVALELLHHKMKTSSFQIICDSSKAELTLYHLAASRGLVYFIEEIFYDKELHQLDVDCPNRDGITPMYLAKIFSKSVDGNDENPWDEVVRFIENQGGHMQYPCRGAEHSVIHNRLHGSIPSDVNLNVRSDVGDFVAELLSSYGHKHTSSLNCGSIITTQTEIHYIFLRHKIVVKLQEQLLLLKRQRFRSRISKDFFCTKELKRLTYWVKASAGITFKSGKVYYSSTQTRLIYLMRTWHEELFGLLPCLKRTFSKYRPYLLDEGELKLMMKQYEDSISLWHLKDICYIISVALYSGSQTYLVKDNYAQLRFLSLNYPDFIRERMGWTDEKSSGFYWPLDFVLSFTLGLYRQFDYLQILNVGFKPEYRKNLIS